jgi:hypothetical protein
LTKVKVGLNDDERKDTDTRGVNSVKRTQVKRRPRIKTTFSKRHKPRGGQIDSRCSISEEVVKVVITT